MHRFFLSPEQCRDSEFDLTGPEAHHATTVLRLRAGQAVTILNGRGVEIRCDVVTVSRNRVRLASRERITHLAFPTRITLIQAVTKPRSMDFIVQKATELGVDRIAPFFSTRSVVRLSHAEGVRRAEKWQATAIDAIKQSGSPWLPSIDAPTTLETTLVHAAENDLALVAALREDARSPKPLLEELRHRQGRPPWRIAVWIGPEGDLTNEELDSIIAAGAHPITLDSLVLRSETAAIYCLSFLRYDLAG